jgi:hypothetical protein
MRVIARSRNSFSKKEKPMKTRKSQFLIVALFIATALLLSACKVNLITDIKSDGSGAYTQELGFTKDEASMAGLSSESSGKEFCTSANSQSGGSELPPGTVVSQEERGDGEIWCIFKTPFTSLDDLRKVYATSDLQINQLSLVDGKVVYDVSIDMSGEGANANIPMGNLYWIVNMPGSITDHNATEVKGNTLKWKLTMGQKNNMRAESNASGFNLGGDTLWYVFGGVAFLCLCCFVPLVIAGVVFFLMRRK